MPRGANVSSVPIQWLRRYRPPVTVKSRRARSCGHTQGFPSTVQSGGTLHTGFLCPVPLARVKGADFTRYGFNLTRRAVISLWTNEHTRSVRTEVSRRTVNIKSIPTEIARRALFTISVLLRSILIDTWIGCGGSLCNQTTLYQYS